LVVVTDQAQVARREHKLAAREQKGADAAFTWNACATLVRPALCRAPARSRRRRRLRIVGRMSARALPQGVAQRDRAVVLLQQIGKGLVGQFLEIAHGVTRQEIERVPGLVVDLDSFARHQRAQRSWRPPCPVVAWKSGVAAPMSRSYFVVMILLPNDSNEFQLQRRFKSPVSRSRARSPMGETSATAETSERRLVRDVATTS